MRNALLITAFLAAAAAANVNEDQARQQGQQFVKKTLTGELDAEAKRDAGGKSVEELVKMMRPGERYQAVDKIKKFLPKTANFPGAKAELGRALALLGDADGAKRVAAELRGKNPEHPGGYLIEAQALLESDPARAREFAAKAVEKGKAAGNGPAVSLGNSIARLSRGASRASTPRYLDPGRPLKHVRGHIERSIEGADRRAMEAAKKLLQKTEIGNDNIVAVFDRMSWRKAEAGKDNGLDSETVKEVTVNGKKMFVAVLSKESLQSDIESLAANMNGKMGRARFLEVNDGKISKVAAQTIELMHTAWAAAQIMALNGSRSLACSISDALCAKVTAVVNIWKGDLRESNSPGSQSQLIRTAQQVPQANRQSGADRVFGTNLKQNQFQDIQDSRNSWYYAQNAEVKRELNAQDQRIRARLPR